MSSTSAGEALLSWCEGERHKPILPVGDQANIEMIRRSNLGFREEREDGLVVFTFAAGQECFTGQGGGHRVALERDPIMTQDSRILEPLNFMDNYNDHMYRRSVNNG